MKRQQINKNKKKRILELIDKEQIQEEI